MTDISNSLDRPVGAFFTPAKWAEWILLKYDILDRWLQGATIFDPTAGQGIFLVSLIKLASDRGLDLTEEMLGRLWFNEKHSAFIEDFCARVYDICGIDFPSTNIFNRDILFFCEELQVDIIVGNPPWQNFNNLETEYKQSIKPLFHQYNLVGNPQDLLLGSSRIDLAALVIAKTLLKNLRINGSAYFLMPLSIFLNDGASKGFRSYKIDRTDFCVQEIYDFKGEVIFERVNTRYGLVAFKRDRKQEFPIRYFMKENDDWQKYEARPLFNDNESLSILESPCDFSELRNHPKIEVPKFSKPRQGINTCGTKDIFIFDRYELVDRNLARVSNSKFQDIVLSKQFLFPLISKDNFQQNRPLPQRYILLPYNLKTGRLLEASKLHNYPLLWQYLWQNQEILKSRKGTLIQAWVTRGYWYALLGVGTYSFAPYKVFWQAYGQKKFSARLFKGSWQGNQAMHAFMPVNSKSDGKKLVERLSHPTVEKYLCSQQIEGTCNWAQPGRISKLLEIGE